jgi:hypothetical protein
MTSILNMLENIFYIYEVCKLDSAPHFEAYFLDHILDTILNRLSNESREFK